jgi:hypothetical protein
LNETKRVGEGLDSSFRDQRLQPLLLARGISDRLPRRVGRANGLKGCAGAAEARFASDIGLVHSGCETLGLSESAKRLTPSAFMR